LDTALKHLQGMRALMAKNAWPVVEHRTELFMTRMEMLLHEGAAQMQMVIGNPREALTSVSFNFLRIKIQSKTHFN
jgi:hypothetical protein